MSIKAGSLPAVGNDLLMHLKLPERSKFVAACESVQLFGSDILCEVGDLISHVYFPIDGFLSVITPIDEKTGFEVGMIGSEGMQGISITFGVDIAPQRVVVQGAGLALRMDAVSFRRKLAGSAHLRGLLGRYAYVLMSQLAQTGACTRFHLLEKRLARWLLMTDDRTNGNELHLTHQFLAYMLGMRRVGITAAAGALQEQQLISYSRGIITIIDRSGLERASCACYGIDKGTYAGILGV